MLNPSQVSLLGRLRLTDRLDTSRMKPGDKRLIQGLYKLDALKFGTDFGTVSNVSITPKGRELYRAYQEAAR
jgi:hypothetical protein